MPNVPSLMQFSGDIWHWPVSLTKFKLSICRLIPLSAAKVGSYLTYFQSKVVNLTYFQSKVIYFGSKVIGSENTAACSPSVSICNRAVGSWTKSSDLVQKIPLSPFYSLSLSSRSMVNMRTLAEYDNFYDDDNFMMMARFWWWWYCDDDPVLHLYFCLSNFF